MNPEMSIFVATIPRGASAGLLTGAAELIPVEPEQGNSCEGKVYIFVGHFRFSYSLFPFVNF